MPNEALFHVRPAKSISNDGLFLKGKRWVRIPRKGPGGPLPQTVRCAVLLRCAGSFGGSGGTGSLGSAGGARSARSTGGARRSRAPGHRRQLFAAFRAGLRILRARCSAFRAVAVERNRSRSETHTCILLIGVGLRHLVRIVPIIGLPLLRDMHSHALYLAVF